MPVLRSHIGKERLLSEAIESHISGWFWNAAARERIRPVEQPELDYELPDSEDTDWRFTATVSVLPKPEVADWTKVQVPYAEPEVPEDFVDHELNVLRSTVAELKPAEGRAAEAGDTIVLDLHRRRRRPARLRRRARLGPTASGARGTAGRDERRRDEGDRSRAGGRRRADQGRGGRQGDQGEGAAGARRRARALRLRVRHPRGAPRRHRAAHPRAGRGRGQRGLPAGRARQARRSIQGPGLRAAGRSPHEDAAARARCRPAAQRRFARRVSPDVRRFRRGTRSSACATRRPRRLPASSCSRPPPTS